MAEGSWPAATYNTGAVTDAEYQRIPWAPDGLIGGPGDALAAVYANSSGREVHIRAGRYGQVLGRAWASGSTGKTLTIAANAAGATRIDTVGLRLDRSSWLVTAAVRQGTAGSGAPALVRDQGDTGLWEIPLADVTVAPGAAVIAADAVRMRALFQAGAVRPAKLLADIQPVLAAGDIVYESATGRWVGWTGAQARVISDDTGDVGLATTAGWALATGGMTGRKWGNVVSIDVNLARSGTSVAQGNDSTLTTLPAELRPTGRDRSFMAHLTGDNYGRVDVQTDGKVVLRNTTINIASGTFLRATLTYLVS